MRIVRAASPAASAPFAPSAPSAPCSEPAPTSRILFGGRRVTVGAFRCPAGHPNFAREGTISAWEIVFPRQAVWIRRPGGRAFVADPNVVTLYNRGQEYERAVLAPAGDQSDWFAVDGATALEVVAALDPDVRDPERPLRFACAPSSPELFLRQRRLFSHLAAHGGKPAAIDELGVEEEVVSLIAEALRGAYAARGVRLAQPLPDESDAVLAAKRCMASDLASPLGLRELADRVGLSMYHLARTFRRETGSTLHAWRLRLRLLGALDALSEAPRRDLTEVALDFGFSSHSHFTAVFRRTFGMPPSALRGASGSWSKAPSARFR